MGLRFTNRFMLIAGIAFFLLIIVIAVAANAASPAATTKPTPTPHIDPPPPPPPTTASYTVQAAVGVQAIIISNQNTGSTITLTSVDLPKTVTVKYGDTITFKVTATAGYSFNYWQFGDNSVDSHNPYTNKLTGALTMEARFLMVGTG